MKKNAVVIIIVAIILILIGVAVYLFVKGSKKGKNVDKDGKIIDSTKDKDGNVIDTKLDTTPPKTDTTPPKTDTATTYTAPKLLDCTKDAFPMGMGAKNKCVQRLQEKLNLTADGKFGNKTNSAVVALGFVVPLTEADFDRIIAGLPPQAATAAPPLSTTSNYEILIRKIGQGAATKRYYNPNYVRVRYDASWNRDELSFYFYESYQTSTTTSKYGNSMDTTTMPLPAETDLVIKAGNKVLAYGTWYRSGEFRIYDIVTKNGKLVAGKGYKDFNIGNIFENIKSFEVVIQ